MKVTLFISAIALVMPVVALARTRMEESSSTGLAHTRTEFSFTVNAPFEQVVPLFGALEERKWAEGWDPQFIYPMPARDVEGEVFKVQHGRNASIWINTALDFAAGHIQYAHVLNNAIATFIDIHASRSGPDRTTVTVSYERTALAPDADEHVRYLTKSDVNAGQEWGDAMNAYFGRRHASASPR